MYSNDMWKYHPESPEYWGQHPLQYWENGEVTIPEVTKEHQKMLTTWYTEKAVDFIQRNSEKPFLLYVPHSMPHVPLFCSDKFEGKSGQGLYADVMMEIDWSVGQILNALEENGLGEKTLVLMTSDNGPWISYGNHAGKTRFREAKGTGFDGGIRSSCIIRYPGWMEAGAKSLRTFGSVDILPTVAGLAEAPLPENPIDGRNVWDFIRGVPDAVNPHDYYAFSTGSNFEGIISGDGRWKLHLPHDYRTLEYPGMDGQAGKYRTERIELSLFDMMIDPLETTNVMDDKPDVAARMMELADQHRQTFYAEE
jgi:arylsulfatase A-like enzyme